MTDLEAFRALLAKIKHIEIGSLFPSYTADHGPTIGSPFFQITVDGTFYFNRQGELIAAGEAQRLREDGAAK